MTTLPAPSARLTVEVWSDVVCPWCYVGKRRFEAALARFEHAADVDVLWRAFELDPHSSSLPDGAQVAPDENARRLAAKFGSDVAAGQEMLASMTATGAAEGLELHFDRALRANTVDAHQVIHLALLRGGPALQGVVKERLLKAHFTDGEAVGDRTALVRLAVEAGLDGEEVAAVLAEGRYVDDVRGDEDEARALGVTGVPFFVVDRRYGVSGAQSPDVLLGALERAWSERAPLVMAGAASGAGSDAACGPDGCAI